MNFCKLCILPNTRPNLFLDSKGYCNACKDHRNKNIIDWKERKRI